MKTGKLLAGIVSGAAIGAIAGILFAPKKGAETRRSITDKGNQYMDGAKNKYSDLADNLSNRYDSVRSKVKGKSKQMETNLDGDDKIIY